MDPPQTIDEKYQIVRLLGEGGMGAVYEARHSGTGRRVAVKVIVSEHAENEGVVARFQREARAAGAIETQHIAHVLDTGTDRVTGNPYMVMEYLQGEDVQQCLKRVGPLDPEVALRVMSQACIGLQKAHEAGVIHRDIKPANLYLAAQDDGAVLVKLLDFGIAKVKVEQTYSAESAALTRTGSLLGSPLYMSPEQAKGSKQTDARTDVWSIGIVFYEVLAGLTPYAHCDSLGGLIFEICSAPPRSVQEIAPWVPPEIAAIVHRALTIDVARRYASVADMQADIRALLPNGNAIHQSMLASMPQHRRDSVAPKLSATATGLSASSAKGGMSPSAQMAIDNAGAMPASSAPGQSGGTAAGLASSRSGVAKKSSRVIPIVAGVALTLGVGAAATYRFAFRPSQSSVAATAEPSSAPSIAPPASAAAPPSATAVAVTTRSVELVVIPASASVEIDGAAATVSAGGVVSINGAPGSVHKVRVFVGKKETFGDIVIAESGAVPSKIELGVKPASPTASVVAGVGAAPPAKTTAATGAAATTPPVTPPATPPPPKPQNPGVDRSFQ